MFGKSLPFNCIRHCTTGKKNSLNCGNKNKTLVSGGLSICQGSIKVLITASEAVDVRTQKRCVVGKHQPDNKSLLLQLFLSLCKFAKHRTILMPFVDAIAPRRRSINALANSERGENHAIRYYPCFYCNLSLYRWQLNHRWSCDSRAVMSCEWKSCVLDEHRFPSFLWRKQSR